MNHKFRTIGSVATVCAMVLFAASCAKSEFQEEGLDRVPGVVRTISADAGLPAPVTIDKAIIDISDYNKVKWESTDIVNFNGTNIGVDWVYSGGQKARFYGKSRALQNLDQTKDIYWAVYPSSLAENATDYVPSNFTATSLTVNFPATQAYDESLASMIPFMSAYTEVDAGTESFDFQMRNLGTILERDMKPYCNNYTRVDSIVFTSSNAKLSGTFQISNNNTNPDIKPISGSKNKLLVTFKSGSKNYIDIAGGKKVRVVLPPLTDKNLTMKIYGTDGRYMTKNAASITLARNYFYKTDVNYKLSSFAAPDVEGFSIAANKRVLFAPANLQYNAVTTVGSGTHWRFAENEWDFVGNATEGNVYVGGVKCDNALVSSSYSGWIDYFGWGTSGWNNGNAFYMPYCTSAQTSYPYEVNVGYGYGPTDGSSYHYSLTGTYARSDWGVYNDIYNTQTNTTDPAGTWRTLTRDEWVYLINSRTVIVECEPKVMYGYAKVNGVKGLVILPDNWDPASYASFAYGQCGWGSISSNNIFTESTSPKWSEMKALGCVFLPAAGARKATSVYGLGTDLELGGLYWSATTQAVTSSAHYMFFNNAKVDPVDYDYRYNARTVRLVKEVH